jgi:hypothetical protein
MAMTLKDIREKYPQYDSKSDIELADAIHGKFYSDLPKEKVYEKLGLGQGENKPLKLELTKSAEPKETEGWKGLASDTIKMLGRALKGGVGFVKRAPGNIKEIGYELIHHPLSYPPHVARQVLAGVGEGAKGLANIPHEIFNELADKKITPDWLRTGSIPEDLGIEKSLGLEETNKSDELLRGIPAIYGGGQLVGKGISKVKKATSPPDLKQAIRDTQAKVNQQTRDAGKIFDHVEKEVKARGISKVPIDSKLIDQARGLLSKTLANKKLFEKAKKGDFDALRKLQGDLRNKGEKGLSSDELSNNDLGELMLETRDEINGSIQNHLNNKGHKDLAEALNKARKDYRKLQQTYHSTNKLSKTFGKDQLVPDNPITLLREESTQMKRFMEAHPELEKSLAKALTHKKKMKRLGTVGKIGATVAGIKGADLIFK